MPSCQSTEATPSRRIITLAELSAHSTEKDCWIAIHGKVYDVTNFLDSHPGAGSAWGLFIRDTEALGQAGSGASASASASASGPWAGPGVYYSVVVSHWQTLRLQRWQARQWQRIFDAPTSLRVPAGTGTIRCSLSGATPPPPLSTLQVALDDANMLVPCRWSGDHDGDGGQGRHRGV